MPTSPDSEMKKNRKTIPSRGTDADILALCAGGGASLMLCMGKGTAPANDSPKPAAAQNTAAEIAEARSQLVKNRGGPTR